MSLHKIGGYTNIYNAYTILPAIENIKVGAVNPVKEPKLPSETVAAPAPQEVISEATEPKKEQDHTATYSDERENASIENIAISFGTYDSTSVEMFGEQGLASEDMKNAIIGMRRDHILHEYQYFVGGRLHEGKGGNIIVNDEDGLVLKL